MGQRSTRQAPLSAAWQARLGVPWLPVNEVADSVFWQNPFTVTARTVPGLRGFVYFDPSPSTFDPVSDDLASIFREPGVCALGVVLCRPGVGGRV
jgi:hypothetical protein